ncbi:phage tail tape measure protein [Thalassobius sp. S69A]|uniref:phage tail tape measure protein n=1 Tax=unclassified Thalassovita TaxID=2619711 RepID=UPI000C0FAD42|nr:phage tail protein [Paracoccaceae bacterium]MBT25356.1 phage tail protein [Paracoccaceae bacterium]
MAEIDGLDGLQDQVDALETSLGTATNMAAGFEKELRRVQVTMGETALDVAALEKGMSRGLRKAFDGVILDGMNLSDALRTVAQSMINTVYAAAVKPVTDHLGTTLTNVITDILPFAKGGSFSQGRVMPFANGGVVSGPTTFPMRGGTGLMGEAGPEAIMPLSRGADGKLGVRMQGQSATTVVMNISTPDVEGFRRSQSQIAAQMGRALGRGQRIR